MSTHLPDTVASARRHFEAGDYRTANPLLEEALATPIRADADSTRDAQARAEAVRLRAAMRHDPLALAAIALTAATLLLLLALYAH